MRTRRMISVGVLAAVVAVVAFVPFALGSLVPSAARPQQYVALDDGHIAVQLVTGPRTEAWVESVMETPATVTIDVRQRDPILIGGSTAAGYIRWVVVSLEAPLHDRRVIDAATGSVVPARP